MSGPWENYAPALGVDDGPWTHYAATGPEPDFFLSVQPDVPQGTDSNHLLPQAPVPVATDGVSESPALRAIAEGATADLIRTAATVPFLQGGISGARGDTSQQDQDFGRYERWRALADRIQSDAQLENSGASRIGDILGFAPQLLTAPTLALNIATQGVDPAAREVEHGGAPWKAYALLGTGTGAGALQAALPASIGASAPARALTGALLGTATGTGSQEAQHVIAPDVVPAPTAGDALVNAGLGSLLGMALGHNTVEAPANGGPHLSPDAPPASLPAPEAPSGGLPRGADFRGEFTTKPDNTPPAVGPVHVDVTGNAYTPAQGAQTLGDAIAAGARPATALPEPVIAVDGAGQAATTADQNAALQAPPRGLGDTLGLTDALRDLVARDPRTAREGPPIAMPALPAPAVTVDRAGTAMTSADFLARARQAQMDADAQQTAQQERQRIGITPDIERTQGARWQAQHVAQLDNQASLDARTAGGELAQQSANDAPPWWMAAQGGERDHAAQRPPAAVPESMSSEITWEPTKGRASLDVPADAASTRGLRRFMAGSKVVDNRGAPLTVYHGTNEEFSVFDGGHHGAATAHSTSPLGHFFSESEAQARHYAENASGGVPAEERVVDAYLSIKHPAKWTLDRLQRIDSPEEARRVRRNLEKSGFDGIHIKDAGQWIAFRPEQIKSASANRGTFDPAHPDIRFLRDTRGEPQRSTGDGQDEASGIPAGLPIDATAETRALSRALGRWVGAEGDDRAPARFGAVRPDSLPDAAAQAIDAFGQATGTRIVLVRNLTPEVDTFNGVRLPELPGVLFVDEGAEHPFVTVAAHEFTHQLEQDNPALWQEIADEVRRQGRLEAYRENLRRRGYRDVDEDLAVRELVGDAVGDAFADPEFLEDLARRNPGVFQRVAQAFKDFLDRLISRVRDLGSSRYLKDVQAFRDKLADVMARYRPEFEQPPGHRPLTEGEPQFSRRPGSENDHLRDMLSRRPGESQADYTNRVLRKNKDQIKQAVKLAKLQRTIGRQEMRAMWAKQARASDIADHAFNEARKMFDLAGDAPNLQSIDEWENGGHITSVEARQFFAQMKDAFDQRIERIHELAPGALQNLIEFYFPHIWEDSAKAAKWYQGLMEKRPLEGGKAFLKQRTWGTIREGMSSGLKPVSTNPVDLVMLKLGQMDKFIAFNEFRQDLQVRGWLRRMDAGERVPLGYARVDDPAFQVAGGLQGYYAVPELIAKDVNNYLSPSLYRHGWWKALRVVQNALMSARLGWSMFHAGFTTTDNLVMHADVAARRFLAGDVAGGLGTLLKTPLTVVWSPIEGHRLNRQWLGLSPADANTAAVLDMLEQGGAHRSMSRTEYDSALPTAIRAIRRRAMGDLVRSALPAVGEASSWIIHHWLVPNQKMAARVMLAKFELDRMAGPLGKKRGDYADILDAMHPDVVKQIAGKVASLVDDRLGQMNYDNQFWNKAAREIAQAAIGAVGWQVGTVRTVTGGARDLQYLWSPEQLVAPLDKAGKITDANLGHVSGRLTYLVSLALLMGGLGAITQYLLTGEGPSEVKDYFFPKTGRKNDDGSDERLQFPSYWADHYKLGTHPIQTMEHKLHPSIGMFMEAIANQDYYGVRIRDEDASWWKQAEQVGEYVAKGFLPYSWTGHQKLEQNHDSAARKVANFFGVTTAPASVSRTPFQAFVAEKAYAAMPQGARTPEQAEHSQQMHAIEAAMRRGEQPDLTTLSPRDQRNALRASRDEVPAIRFRRLGIEDKLRAYELATPKERDEYRLRDIILRSNWRESVRNLAPDERQAVVQRVLDLRS